MSLFSSVWESLKRRWSLGSFSRGEIPLEASCKYPGERLKEHITLPICWTNMWTPQRTFFSITHICSTRDVAFSKQGNRKKTASP